MKKTVARKTVVVKVPPGFDARLFAKALLRVFWDMDWCLTVVPDGIVAEVKE